MGTFTAYRDSAFSENLRELTYAGPSGEPVQVSISIVWNRGSAFEKSNEFAYNVVIPSSGEIAFNVADILRPFRANDRNLIRNAGGGGHLTEITVHIAGTDIDDTWSQRLYIGGYKESESEENRSVADRCFLTSRPQTDETVPGLLQFLTVDMSGSIDGYLYMEKTLMARLYFRYHKPLEVQVGPIPKRGPSVSGRPQTVYDFQNVSADYGTVRSLADGAGIGDEIVAYDLWGTLAGEKDGEQKEFVNVPYPQRFIVRRAHRDWSYFMFLNSLSGIDTVIARGQCRTMMEGETASFVNGDEETEISNDARIYREVNTGYIRSREYRELWYEFFRSPLRSVTDLSGTVRNIIVDEYQAEYNGYREPVSFTFKYHMADMEHVEVPARSELEEHFQDYHAI